MTQRGRGGRGGRGGGGGRGTSMVGATPTTTPPPTTEATTAARIKQLEQRLATMASFQHRSHSRGEFPRRPIKGHPFQLHTDWSMLGLRAVLT